MDCFDTGCDRVTRVTLLRMIKRSYVVISAFTLKRSTCAASTRLNNNQGFI